MSTSAARYPDWKAPAEDGEVLLWPGGGKILSDAGENHDRLSRSCVFVQRVPLAEIRRQARRWIGHEDSTLLLATGHQTELYHPGVWIKDVLIDAAAKKVGGQAVHFAVDTDEPKHLLLRWPGGGHPLTDDEEVRSAAWSGLLQPPTPMHLQELERNFTQAASQWNFSPLAGEFLASMRRLLLNPSSLPWTLTNAMHELDWSLGMRHIALLVSPILHSEPYLAFVHHLLAQASALAAHYNAALAEYRAAHGIKNPGRPMPDLKLAADSCEAPFWLDSLNTGTRSRAALVGSAGRWRLELHAGETFVFEENADGWAAADALGRWLRDHQLRLSPRALTLTMFLRLMIVDQFAHGIGGGQYDQVADALIGKFFGVEPPRFCVTTATLYFPEAVGRPRACLPCVLQEGHRLRHNVLGERKMELVRQIEDLPRGSLQRSVKFLQMHQMLKAAADHPAIRQWETRLQQTREQLRQDQMLFDRELFYALQPCDRLMQLIDRTRASLDQSL